MEDRPRFEVFDGALVHPILAPSPSALSAKERAEAELSSLLAYCRRGGGGEPWFFGLGRER